MELKKYRGYEINYNENAEKFVAYTQDGEEVESNSSLKILKLTLDKICKKQIKRIAVLHREGDEISEAIVTSIASGRRDGCWLIDPKTKRRAKNGGYYNDLYKPNERNHKLAKEINAIKKQIITLEHEAEKKEAKLEEYPLKELRRAMGYPDEENDE